MSAICALVEELRTYGLEGAEALRTREASPPMPPTPQPALVLDPQRMREMIEELAAASKVETKPPSSPEQEAMLDLARFFELNEEDWSPRTSS